MVPKINQRMNIMKSKKKIGEININEKVITYLYKYDVWYEYVHIKNIVSVKSKIIRLTLSFLCWFHHFSFNVAYVAKQ